MSKGYRRNTALILAVLMIVALFAACGSSSTKTTTATTAPAATAAASAAPAASSTAAATTTEGKEYTLGVTVWGSGVPILDGFGDQNEYVFHTLGCKTSRMSDDFTADKELQNVQNLCSSGVDGIVTQASAVTTVPQMAATCKDSKIPIVFDVSCGLEDDLKALQENNEYYVGAVDANMYLDGQIIAQKAYDDGCRTAVMIGGNVGDQDIDKRMNGFTDKFEELGGKVLANARCTDASECPTKAEDMLSANKDADCIYATVGDYVAGSMSAIDNLSLSTKVYLSCTDEDSANYIKEGKIAAGNDGIGLAAAIAPTLLINYLDGHKILDDNGKAPRLQTTPFTITKDTAAAYLSVFYGDNVHPFTEDMIKDLCFRYNPDVSYQDYVDLCKNLDLNYILKAHGLDTVG